MSDNPPPNPAPKVLTNHARVQKKIEAGASYLIAASGCAERKEAVMGLEDLVEYIMKNEPAYEPVGGHVISQYNGLYLAEQAIKRKS